MNHESRKRRPLLAVFLAVIAVFTVLVGAAAFILYPTFRDPPVSDYPAPATPEEGQRQDLDYLRRVMAIDRSFSSQERQAFEDAAASIEQRIGQLDRADFEMAVSRAVALAENGHTNVQGASRGLDLNSVPIRMVWFAEGLHVVSAAPQFADLLGARVLNLEGQPPETLAAQLADYVGGSPEYKREMSPNFLASPEALHAVGIAASPSQLRFSLQLRDGTEVERTIAAVERPVNGPPTDEPVLRTRREIHWPRRNLSPVASPVDPPQWSHLLSTEGLPLYLQHPDRFYWHTLTSDPATLYVQINANRSEQDGEPMPDYLARVIEDARAANVREAIIDLRFNAGGNYQLAAEFAEELPSVVPSEGRIYIVTSGNTWSAGLVTAARLKHFAGERGVIVGEEVGDTPQFWAEGKRAEFPNLGVRISYATAYHDWENGCSWRQIATCFFMNYTIGVAAGDLSPNLPAPIRFEDYLAGRDNVMLAIDRHRAAAH